MLDLHCHILPGVDDGARSLDESLAMARLCAADGMTHIVATPHCNNQWRLLREPILAHVSRLNAHLAEAKVPLTILPGAEIQLTDTAAYRRDFDAGVFCHLGDSRAFTLLEFPWNAHQFPSDSLNLVRWLLDQKMTPIIAHPERQSYLLADHLPAMVEAGAWIQVTVDALVGRFGETVHHLAVDLLRDHPNAVLSTDAHNMHRCSGLSAGFTWVRENLGASDERRLRDNANAVLTAIHPQN